MRHLAAALVVASAVAGCAGPPRGGGTDGFATHCDGSGACKVSVSVSGCVITPDPATLDVDAKNINIFWELDAASSVSYRFPDDGVRLKAASSEFDEPEAQGFRKKFKLHDKNTLSGTTHRYEYAIKVQKLEWFKWVDCPILDPWVVNH